MNYYYDVGPNTWGQTQSQGATPGGALSYYSVVGVGKQALVTGGLSYDANTKKSTPMQGVWIVDIDTWEWTRLGDLPFPVAGHGGVFDGDNNRMIVWAETASDMYMAAFLFYAGVSAR